MSFFLLLSTVLNDFDNGKNLNYITKFIISQKPNIQINLKDAFKFLIEFLPKKYIINFDKIKSIEQFKSIDWYNLKIQNNRDKKYVSYCLLFILIYIIKPTSEQTLDYAKFVKLIEQVKDLKVKNYDFGTGTLNNVIIDVCTEVENKKFHDHFEFNFPFCDSVIEIFKTRFPTEVLSGKVFNQVLYFVPKKVVSNPDFKDQKETLFKIIPTKLIDQSSLIPVHFPRLAKNNKIYFSDKKYVMNYGIDLYPIFVQKLNKGYLDYKLRDMLEKKNTMELSNIDKLHNNTYKHLAFDYSNLYNAFKINDQDPQYTQKYDFISNIYNEFVTENISIIFVPDIAKEIGFIHSYMQENGYDNIDPKKANYWHVLGELVNFSQNQVQKERFTRSYKYGLRDSYGPQILSFLKYHNLNPSERLSIENFFITNKKSRFFPSQTRTSSRSSAPKPAPKPVNAGVAKRSLIFRSAWGRNSYLNLNNK